MFNYVIHNTINMVLFKKNYKVKRIFFLPLKKFEIFGSKIYDDIPITYHFISIPF